MRSVTGKKLIVLAAVVGGMISAGSAFADNVTMSRHNLSRLTSNNVVLWQEGSIPAGQQIGAQMAGSVFDQFNEVCVYCHTPHGAGTVAPLWNRVVNTSGNYTPYGSSTIDTSVGQPGGVSLACLSCHDGTIAVDNIVNAPGSGNYYATGQVIMPDGSIAKLGGKNPTTSGTHMAMKVNGTGSCNQCHQPNGVGGAHDGAIKYLGTDMRITHPVSMTYPTLTGVDPMFKAPGTIPSTGQYIFTNGVKLYNGKVECPSCHNPHLGEADYAQSPALRPFLRTSNENSALCTTCHIK